MFHFQNGGCLAFMFSSFLMTLFLLPAERRNKIRVKKGKFFDECVGSVSADVSVVCRPTCRWCVGGVSTDALADVLADASVGSDSLPLP